MLKQKTGKKDIMSKSTLDQLHEATDTITDVAKRLARLSTAFHVVGNEVVCTHMDDLNSPQTYVSLELNEEDMKARLEYACGIDPINGGIRGEQLYIVQGESGVGKSKLAEHLTKTSDPVIIIDSVPSGTSCGKSTFMDELVYKLEPQDFSYPEFFTEEPNFFASKIVQNGKRKKKKR